MNLRSNWKLGFFEPIVGGWVYDPVEASRCIWYSYVVLPQ